MEGEHETEGHLGDKAYRLQHEWKKRSPVLDEEDRLETMDIVVDEITRLAIPDMTEIFPEQSSNVFNIHPGNKKNGATSNESYYRFVQRDECILADIIRHSRTPTKSGSYVRAGPRERLFFDPKRVIAGIVTCGGLCPGLNNVIREIVRTLHNLYGVNKVYGFVGGYGGIYLRDPVLLTVESVAEIHHIGGSMLRNARGGFDEEKIFNKLKELGVNQFYLIGGDGTMRGADKLSKYFLKVAKEQNHFISCAGVPKTIDNDIDIMDKSFGFSTAVAEAIKAVQSAKVEALGAPNGVGVVKLMGRYSGFIATHAALASSDADCCLIPEVPIVLDGPEGMLEHIKNRAVTQGHAVVIVAEGAGEDLLGINSTVDAGGNRKLPQIGEFLKAQIEDYLRKSGIEPTVKYIDPSYMIRSVPANSSDSLMCLLLAQNVVHGSMAGYTAFCTAICNSRTCYLPMGALVRYSPRHVDIHGRTYDRVIAVTGQPRNIDNIDQLDSINPKTFH